MIILKILLFGFLYLLLFLLAMILILIISPIKGRFSFQANALYFKASYLFGLIRVTYDQGISIRILGFKLASKSSKPKVEKEVENLESTETEDSGETEDKQKKDSKTFKRPSLTVIKLTLTTAKKLITIIAPKECRIYLKLGINDPYYIGMMSVFTNLFFMPLNRINNYDLQFQPVFDDIAIDYNGRIQVNFSLIRLLIPLLTYILKKPIRQYFNILNFKNPFKKTITTKTLKRAS